LPNGGVDWAWVIDRGSGWRLALCPVVPAATIPLPSNDAIYVYHSLPLFAVVKAGGKKQAWPATADLIVTCLYAVLLVLRQRRLGFPSFGDATRQNRACVLDDNVTRRGTPHFAQHARCVYYADSMPSSRCRNSSSTFLCGALPACLYIRYAVLSWLHSYKRLCGDSAIVLLLTARRLADVLLRIALWFSSAEQQQYLFC